MLTFVTVDDEQLLSLMGIVIDLDLAFMLLLRPSGRKTGA